ncbi:hypothetical protein B7Y94_04270 [Candidatus Saccharibacteria bacterium 32-49-12]|nr:MAG: hypothetical protein B7Y94_04270 [Candidatus Saccharibacteria bacterium 32-49-12]
MGRLKAALTLKKARQTRQRGRAIRRVADKLGLVYFGGIDAKHDDIDTVRGVTTSTTHRDKHFAIGTYDGYDLSIVDRHDLRRQPTGRRLLQRWTIVHIKLINSSPDRHSFFMPLNRSEEFESLFVNSRQLVPLDRYIITNPPVEYSLRYQTLIDPSRYSDLEPLLDSSLYNSLITHFWPHAVELKGRHLFVYLTEHRLDETVLEQAIQSALWLAELIDSRTTA